MAEATVIEVERRLDRSTAGAVVRDLHSILARRPQRLIVDLRQVEEFDSAGMGVIVHGLRHARASGVELRLRGLSKPMLDFFSLLSVERLTCAGRTAERPDPITRIGAALEPMLCALGGVLRTAGQTVHALCVAPLRGQGLRFDRTVLELDHAAIGALPITVLIGFLLGLILAMQAYVQLRVWGVELYIADMVGVSTVTEIGPLMSAIILAARSGSSNAAQLGAMVVSEEVDALRQMGVHPVRFLVVPKVLALCAATVMLCLLFDLMAVVGGCLFAGLAAGISTDVYLEQTRTALQLPDFVMGMSKALVFGGVVGVVGCALGLRVTGGSEGVGRSTTNAVVLSVFLIIVIDALFVTAQRVVFA